METAGEVFKRSRPHSRPIRGLVRAGFLALSAYHRLLWSTKYVPWFSATKWNHLVTQNFMRVSLQFSSRQKLELKRDACLPWQSLGAHKGSKHTGGVQGWRSGESTRLPPMWPGFDSQTRRHMWVKFVASLLCTERFSPGTPVSPLLKNQHLTCFVLERFSIECRK